MYKQKETAITEKLHGEELVSELDTLRAEGESRALLAQTRAAAAQAALDSSSGKVSVSDRDARIAALKKTLADAQALSELHKAHLEGAKYEIERRIMRAAVEGTVADIVPCTPGLEMKPGETLATVVPRSPIHVVSFFRPEDAIGRVSRGQAARLRIDNFPWTQYGTVDALVDRVGSEPRDGTVRVELIVARPNPSIPMLHGLTGQAEVEVEKLSPFRLLLRMAGQQMSPRTSPPRPPSASGDGVAITQPAR
jgi:membrane fusion protein (multidrug efflux system)